MDVWYLCWPVVLVSCAVLSFSGSDHKLGDVEQNWTRVLRCFERLYLRTKTLSRWVSKRLLWSCTDGIFHNSSFYDLRMCRVILPRAFFWDLGKYFQQVWLSRNTSWRYKNWRMEFIGYSWVNLSPCPSSKKMDHMLSIICFSLFIGLCERSTRESSTCLKIWDACLMVSSLAIAQSHWERKISKRIGATHDPMHIPFFL